MSEARNQQSVVVADRPYPDAVIDEMIDQHDQARVCVLIFVNRHGIIGARDLAPVGRVGCHRRDDQRHHVDDVDGARGPQGLLVDPEIPDGLRRNVVVNIADPLECCTKRAFGLVAESSRRVASAGYRDIALMVPGSSDRGFWHGN